MRLKLISCDLLSREMRAAVARSPHEVDIELLSTCLQDRASCGMLQEIQGIVDRVDAKTYQGVLLGYGFCGKGLAGLTARFIPIVLPRAHDCVTMFVGDKERDMDYFRNHAGLSFKTSDWIERGTGTSELRRRLKISPGGLAARYGTENAEFLQDKLPQCQTAYSRFIFIEMGAEPDDMSLIEGLVNGDWDPERYLVIQPGWRVVARHDGGIIDAERVA